MQCKGFLFDLDGTLVDSLPTSEKIWREWAHEHKVNPDEVLGYIHGRQAISSLRYFLHGQTEDVIQNEWLELEKRECNDTADIIALPGVHSFLEFLEENNIPWAIVTSGTPKLARARHAAAKLPMPKVFITAEQIKNSKPHPEPFLLGAQELGLSPSDCIVVEDAIAGIQSGLAAGCKVIAVNAPSAVNEIEHIDLVISSLESILLQYIADGSVKIQTEL